MFDVHFFSRSRAQLGNEQQLCDRTSKEIKTIFYLTWNVKKAMPRSSRLVSTINLNRRMTIMNSVRLIQFALMLLGMWLNLFLNGCASVEHRSETLSMDNADHHYWSGMEFIKTGELDRAQEEFERAKALDPNYGPADAGLGLAMSEKGQFVKAEEHLETAERNAKNNDQKIIAQCAYIQFLSTAKVGNWQEKVQKRYKKANKINPKSALLHFTMGKAMEKASQYDQAEQHFKTVLALNRGFTAEADHELKRVQMIKRASPGTQMGHHIALLDELDRADTAALFVEELQLVRLLEDTAQTQAGFQTPQDYTKSSAGDSALTAVPDEVSNHPLRADIEKVLGLQIRGLEIFPDGEFKPSQPITRANFSVMVEDILVKVNQDPRLASKYIDNKSPYKDLPQGHYAFNAIMVCTMQNLMEPLEENRFGLDRPVSGAEALMVIRNLKNNFKRFE